MVKTPQRRISGTQLWTGGTREIVAKTAKMERDLVLGLKMRGRNPAFSRRAPVAANFLFEYSTDKMRKTS